MPSELSFGAHLIADLAHHHGAVRRQGGIEGTAAIGLPQRRIETGGDAGLGLQQIGT